MTGQTRFHRIFPLFVSLISFALLLLPSMVSAGEIHEACRAGNAQKVRQLLEDGVNPNAISEKGYSPLYLASAQGSHRMIKTLIEHGADVNQSLRLGVEPLHAAARYQSARTVNLFLQHGAHVNASVANGVTPLMAAVRDNDRAVVETLIDSGASLSARRRGRLPTPLHVASVHRTTPIVRLLLDHDAPLDMVGSTGKTALHAAAEKTEHPDVVLELLRAGANANREDYRGRLPLDYALENDTLKGTSVLERLKNATD